MRQKSNAVGPVFIVFAKLAGAATSHGSVGAVLRKCGYPFRVKLATQNSRQHRTSEVAVAAVLFVAADLNCRRRAWPFKLQFSQQLSNLLARSGTRILLLEQSIIV